MDEPRKFVAPELVVGSGARSMAGRYAANVGLRRVLVVSDPGVGDAGWTAPVTDSLGAAGVEWEIFLDVTPNPRVGEVARGAERYRAAGCDGIVVVGGGSPIDCAKGIGIVATGGQDIRSHEGVDAVSVPMPPLICVPTTAGTGADVSQFAIFRDDEQRSKFAVISKAVIPDVSLVDAETTTTMDRRLTACTGLDALAHAVEAFGSNASSPLSDLLALEAIRLLNESLPTALDRPDDVTSREPVMRASLYAGLAFSSASLGLVHAMAHALGGALDAAHGECNAVLLPDVVEFNSEAAPERYRAIAGAMGLEPAGVGDDEVGPRLGERIRELCRNIGLSHTMSDLGVASDLIPELAATALRDPCLVTNPRTVGRGDLELLYAQAL